jgi:alpha-tubulin suppressor-like RCC1 family protein
MELRKSSGLLACAGLLLATLLSGCGGSSSNTTIPATTTIFYGHSAVFKNTSTLMTTGYNGFGQLGVGSLKSQAVLLPALQHVDRFALGGDHTLALSFANLSSVYAWGSNYHGQIGSAVTTTGSSAYNSTPLKISRGFEGPVRAIAAGGYHSLAVADSSAEGVGTVFCWGYNGYGQLGNGQVADSTVPVKVVIGISGGPKLTGVKEVAGGGLHSLALTTDDRVYSWGDNQVGQLGRASNSPPPITNADSTAGLVQVPSDQNDSSSALITLTNVKQIAVGGSTNYALLNDEVTIWAWGYNAEGQLGINPNTTTLGFATNLYRQRPVKIDLTFLPTGVTVKQISAGTEHVLARLSDGRVIAWGYNGLGQVGINDNSTTNGPDNTMIITPRFVLYQGSTTLGSGTQIGTVSADGLVTDIFAFGNHSLAKLGSNPGVWYGWGDNGFGQLGFTVSTNAIGYKLVPVVMQGY